MASSAARATVVLLLAVVSWVGVSLVADAQSDACTSDLSTFLPAPFNTSGLSCTQVWNDFVLRYSLIQEDVLNIILSTVYTSGWIAMGFSPDGRMVNSSAMVAWMGRDRKPHVRQYFLGGQSSSKVKVNHGDLQTVYSNRPNATLRGPNLYMSLQLKFPGPVTQKHVLFAFGTEMPTKYVLTEHEDKTSILFNFSKESAPPSPYASYSFSYPYKLKRTHGALAIVGWGVLLPIGVIVSRYCKQWDPLWFYLHVGIQFVGFIIGLAAVVAGISLYDKLHVNIQAHRSLGIFVLVLGILQILAFFLRPNIDSKYRRYWNWYHHWTGRIALLIAAVNIVLGIKVGGAGKAWKIGYGLNLGTILIASIVLEIMLWLRGPKKTNAPAY